MELELRALRAQMEALDIRLAELFESRMMLFAQAASIYAQNGKVPNEGAFEAETIDMLDRHCQGPASAYVPLFFESLYELGHDYQNAIIGN